MQVLLKTLAGLFQSICPRAELLLCALTYRGPVGQFFCGQCLQHWWPHTGTGLCLSPALPGCAGSHQPRQSIYENNNRTSGPGFLMFLQRIWPDFFPPCPSSFFHLSCWHTFSLLQWDPRTWSQGLMSLGCVVLDRLFSGFSAKAIENELCKRLQFDFQYILSLIFILRERPG